MNLSIWGTLVAGFSSVIEFFYQMTVTIGYGNYGLAIILLTATMKMLLYPLTAKQMKSVKAMQEIQPQIKELQEKHRKNPEKAQKAVMELYREKKVNPLAGCLPLLIQMPILIAFYQALLRFNYADPSAAGFLWIANLSQSKPSDPYYILPILTAAATYWQQRVSTASPNDPTQRTMLYTMPLFLGYIAYTVPAGLALYWVVFSVLGAVQQLFINRSNKTAISVPAAPSEGEGKRKKGDKDKK